MPNFRYTATTHDGLEQHGVMIAQNQTDLAAKLARANQTLTDAVIVEETTNGRSFLDRFTSVPEVHRIFFTQNLRVMLHAGLPLGRALRTLADQISHKFFQKIIEHIRVSVESGVTLSSALAQYPRVFPELFVSMIAAGEQSGKLDEILSRLTIQLKKSHTLRAKTRNAMIYPIIVTIGMIAVSVVMLVVVLPKITEIFNETGAKLPLPTRILMAMSHFLVTRGLIVAAAVIILLAITIWFGRTLRGKRFFHALLLRSPIIGPIVQKMNLANFTRSMSSLLSTDIPIVQTFQIIARTMSNIQYRESLQAASEQLKTGASLVKTLEAYPRLYPPVVSQMISIGEESGTLDSVSSEVATFYEEEVDQTMANLSTIIEPIIILVLGLGVAAIAVAVILPIYSLGNQIN